MSHELDVNEATGEAAMISRIETPWHRLGIVFDPSENEMDLDSALRLAGLDFVVKKYRHGVDLPTEDGDVERVESDDAYSIVRLDRRKIIGTVGPNYKPLQQEEAFGPLRSLIDDGIARIETAGSLRGGAQVWMLVRFDVETIVKKALEAGASETLLSMLVDETLPYGLFTNDHSGKAKARIKETAIRVVCANTFAMSMSEKHDGISVEIVHGQNVVENYRAAAQLMLSGMAERYAKLAEARALMEATPLRDYAGWGERPFQRLVLDPMVPVAHLEEKIRRRDENPRTKAALKRATDLRAEIRQLWDSGRGHSGDGSTWEAFQGAVEWIDHSDSAVRGQDDRDERRARSLHDGTLAAMKSGIARRLFAYAAADDEGKRAMVFGKKA